MHVNEPAMLSLAATPTPTSTSTAAAAAEAAFMSLAAKKSPTKGRRSLGPESSKKKRLQRFGPTDAKPKFWPGVFRYEKNGTAKNN